MLKEMKRGYLLRRVPPALGDAGVFLHSLFFDQLLALTLQLLNLTVGTNQDNEREASEQLSLHEGNVAV